MARFVRVSSEHRTSGTPGSFSIPMSPPLPAGRYRLTQVMLPHTTPPVPATGKELVVSTDSGSTAESIAMGVDCYTAGPFLAALATKLGAKSGGTWTVAVDPASNVVSLQQAGGTATTLYPEMDRPESTLAPMLGVYEETTIGADSTVQLQGMLNLATQLVYEIDIAGAVGETTSSTGRQSSFSVPINVNSFQLVDWRACNNAAQYIDVKDEQSVLAVEVRTDRGVPVNTVGGLRADFMFVLERQRWGVGRVK